MYARTMSCARLPCGAAAQGCGALAHVGQAMATPAIAPGSGGVEATAVVVDVQMQAVAGLLHANLDLTGGSVPRNIVECLPQDAQQAQYQEVVLYCQLIRGQEPAIHSALAAEVAALPAQGIGQAELDDGRMQIVNDALHALACLLQQLRRVVGLGQGGMALQGQLFAQLAQRHADAGQLRAQLIMQIAGDARAFFFT